MGQFSRQQLSVERIKVRDHCPPSGNALEQGHASLGPPQDLALKNWQSARRDKRRFLGFDGPRAGGWHERERCGS